MTDKQRRLEALVTDRLEHLADRVEWLYINGHLEDAKLLKAEGLMLADAYDREENFFAIDTKAFQ